VSYVELDHLDLALASLLLLVNVLLSRLLDLGISRSLVVAAVRMTVQLLLIGLVLKSVFAIASPWLTGGLALLMVAFAGYEILARQQRRLAGAWAYGLGTSSMMLAAMTVTVLALTTSIRPDPWFDPRYAIPLLGMILGNTLTGISLAVNELTTGAERDRARVEARLALGGTRVDALRPIVKRALRTGFTPIVNSMAATGVVSLPGMMTGQILAGVDPTQAVRYQLLVMFLIGGATGFGVLMAVLATAWRLSDDRHRLRLDRLQPAQGTARGG
jgi:putative ABC transport system permease protein